MMKRLLDVVLSRWVMHPVLLVTVSMIVWIGSPLLWIGGQHPFRSTALRWGVIAVIVAIALLVLAWRRWRADRSNQSVVGLLLATAVEEKSPRESDDLRALRERFESALIKLRKARFVKGGAWAGLIARLNGRSLYELPWYLIIGAPGSGKTTALQNCGLNFPLASNSSEHAIRGVGGTRSCDWWFTDQAVLIDTAGRFTTQDSDRDSDRATWSGFLGMLKRARPRQPVNGVLVTVSVSDLLTPRSADRRAHAETVRGRLQELHQDLGIRFPIYVLVTKSDLLAGFMDYFELLDKEQRAAPWGTSFPLEDGTAKNVQRFGPEFDALLQRIDDGLIERLQAEHDPNRRARAYGFANQLAGVRALLIDFLEVVFAPSPHEAEPMLRGVYFVSGTQEGTPIDRVLGAIARNYGLERAVIAPHQASGKSYFLARLLGDVVFAESGIAGSNLQWEQRRRLFTTGGYIALAVVTGGALAAWTTLFLDNRRHVEALAARVEIVHQLLQHIPDRGTHDVTPLLPALVAMQALASAATPHSTPIGFGLDPRAKLEGAAHEAYDRMLVDGLLPRLDARLVAQLRESRGAGQGRYETLKNYLMLHEPNHADIAALKAAIEAEWNDRGGRAIDAERRAQLSSQLASLFALGPRAQPESEDAALVAFHRSRLTGVDLPRRLYGRLREQGLGTEFPEFPEFDIARVAGDKAIQLFVRASGVPITNGVPGFFSAQAYSHGFATRAASVIRQTADDQGWVLRLADPVRSAAAMTASHAALLEAMRRLYLDDYARAWEAYLSDLKLAPATTPEQAIDTTRALAASDSPLAAIVKAAVHETTLGSSGANLSPPASTPAIEHLVDDRFIALRRQLVATESGNTPLANALALIGELNGALVAAEAASSTGAMATPSSVPARLAATAINAPAPLHAVLESLARSSAPAGR